MHALPRAGCVSVLKSKTIHVLLSFYNSRFQAVKEYADELETTFKSLLDIRQVYWLTLLPFLDTHVCAYSSNFIVN